jgi:hypothetical protein
MLSLSDQIAFGAERIIYRHPARSDLVVKVRRSGSFQDRNAIEHRFYRWAFASAKSMLPACHGRVATDQGPGMAFELIVDTDGGISPPLPSAVKDGLLAVKRAEAMIEQFFDKAERCGPLIYDHNPGNFLYQSWHGSHRLVLVDGFGPRNWSWRAAWRSRFPLLARRKTRAARLDTMEQWRLWRRRSGI